MSPRDYANFFEYPDRDRKELGILEELIRSLNDAGGPYFSDPASHTPDPPDCVARNAAGQLVAFEITEVVSQAAVELDARGDKVLALWEPGDLTTVIEHRLATKDAKRFQGGPYDEIVVVLHTDEFYLSVEAAESELEGTSFGPFTRIGDAYLIFSYSPQTKGYPVVRIRVAKPRCPQKHWVLVGLIGLIALFLGLALLGAV